MPRYTGKKASTCIFSVYVILFLLMASADNLVTKHSTGNLLEVAYIINHTKAKTYVSTKNCISINSEKDTSLYAVNYKLIFDRRLSDSDNTSQILFHSRRKNNSATVAEVFQVLLLSSVGS